jgi:tetratricopeptide (TPR) repeat protein
LKLSTEGLERPLSTYRESRLPLVFILGFLLFISIGFFYIKNHTLNEIYLNYKEKFIVLNLEEKKEYLSILYNKKSFAKSAQILQEIISFPKEDNEENNAFLAFLYFKLEKYEKALFIYKKLINDSDSPEQYIFYYASCLFHQGEIDKALALHYQLFAIDNAFIDNVESILRILLKKQKKQEGLDFLGGYFRKYPSAQDYLGLYEHRFEQIIDHNKVDSSVMRIHGIDNIFHTKIKIGTNGELYTYIIDTGASFMTISPIIFKNNKGVIKKTGKRYTFLNADGIKNEEEEVYIDWIKIGDIELKNVKAILKQKGDNLLGQSVLDKLNINIQKENNINVMTLRK